MVEDGPGRARLAAIRARWLGSGEQRALTRKALQEGDLSLANSEQELRKRSERLGTRDLTLEGIVESDDALWLSFLSAGLTAARAVGRIVHSRSPSPISPIGTGSLVSPRLLLTNHHVCPVKDAAKEMAVQFSFEYDDSGNPRKEDTRALEPNTFYLTDSELDFTLVAVANSSTGQPPGRTYGHLPLIEMTGKAVMGEPLNVIHHPAGERKKVSIRYNRMVAEDDTWIRYESDTKAGSSGAPVFNDQWEMVALHHGGIPRTNANGRNITSAGEIWNPAMGEDALGYVGNEGARVSRIVKRIKEAEMPSRQRQLLKVIIGSGE